MNSNYHLIPLALCFGSSPEAVRRKYASVPRFLMGTYPATSLIILQSPVLVAAMICLQLPNSNPPLPPHFSENHSAVPPPHPPGKKLFAHHFMLSLIKLIFIHNFVWVLIHSFLLLIQQQILLEQEI